MAVQAPRSLSKGPLGSEMFLPNPQYAVGMTSLGMTTLGRHGHGEQAVTLINCQRLTLQENIGEGCFGKVYRGESLTRDNRRRVNIRKIGTQSIWGRTDEAALLSQGGGTRCMRCRPFKRDALAAFLLLGSLGRAGSGRTAIARLAKNTSLC